MTVSVKVCGLTSPEAVDAAVLAGVDAVGFVFARKSPRFLGFAEAAALAARVPASVRRVGLFLGQPMSEIPRLARGCGLDAVQVYDPALAPESLELFGELSVIAPLSIATEADLAAVERFAGAWLVLADAPARELPGGTGERCDWALAARARALRPEGFMLAGGLSPENVGAAIRAVRPDWVDASSALESEPGRKDPELVRAFVRAAKETRP